MYDAKFYQKANKIRSKLLLFIDNELQKKKKKSSSKNQLHLKQNPLKEETFEISLEDEVFSNDEEKPSFYCAVEKSDKKNNLYIWGEISKSVFDLNTTSTCEITPNKKILNIHNFFNLSVLRNYYKHKTAPEKSKLSSKNLCCIPERGMKKIYSLATNLCNHGLTPDLNDIKNCITFKSRRKDNHDEEYLLNLCHQFKIIKKKTNTHNLLKPNREKSKVKRKIHTIKSKKNPCSFLINNKKISSNFIKLVSNNDSSTPAKNRKKKGSASKFYKNNTFSSCICFKVKSTSKLKEHKSCKKNNH